MSSSARLPRLLRLIDVLQSGRILNSQQLAQECSVSRRTFYRDVAVLQEAGLHVFYDEQRQGYYLPLRLRLPPGDLTVNEVMSLLLVCGELSDGGSGIPFQQAAHEAAMKIVRGLPAQVRDAVTSATEPLQIRLGPRDPLQAGRQHYEVLTQSLIERKQVRMAYASLAEHRTITTLLSPYRMVFSRRSWYVIGRSSMHRTVRTFNLSRIERLESVDSTYQVPPRFSLDRYLGNAWHMIRSKPFEVVVRVRFSRLVSPNVSEVRWHKTQQVEMHEDGTATLSFVVDGLTEIQWWILGYGAEAEVLEPPELRTMIAGHLHRMGQQYRD